MPTLIGINFLGTKNRTDRWVSNLNPGVPGNTTMKKPSDIVTRLGPILIGLSSSTVDPLFDRIL